MWTSSPSESLHLNPSNQPPNPRSHICTDWGFMFLFQEVGAKLAKAEAQGQSPSSNPRGHLAHTSLPLLQPLHPACPLGHLGPAQQVGPISLNDRAQSLVLSPECCQ